MAMTRLNRSVKKFGPAHRRIGAICAIAAISGCTATPDLPRRHMISAAHPLASEAGRDILRAGGSAVDAAIAAQAVLTLVEPQSSGIGGGAFLLHFRKSDSKTEAYDGRETAPAGIRSDVFLDGSGKRRRFRDASTGGQATGVPGVLRMLALAHRDHGRLPWARLFDRAIALSENGFRITPRLHGMVRRSSDLAAFPAARRYFLTPDGAPKPVGTVLRNPALAETYRRVAANGVDAFYTGAIANSIAAAVQNAARNPGSMTTSDIAAYRAMKRTALCRPYRVWRICGMPPPTSGGVTMLQILGLVERFELAALKPSTSQAIHLISEASRLAFADRNIYIGDPDFVDVPVDGLLAKSYLRRRSGLISGTDSLGKARPGTPAGVSSGALKPGNAAEHQSTTHLSVIDGLGNAISMTSSIERAFGSRVMAGGFLLNNQLTDFAFVPRRDGRKVANAVAPGKRPRSSMSPTLIFDRDGRLVATIGSPGGSRIIGYVAQAIIAHVDWGMDVQQAVAMPHGVNRFGTFDLEAGTPMADMATALAEMGFNTDVRDLNSGLHAIAIGAEGLQGGADPRREGIALGE